MLLLLFFLVCSSVHVYSSRLNGRHAQPEILKLATKRGYPSELHQVTTSDGYVLTMYRIPHGRTSKNISKRPVLLQHALFVSADIFLFPDGLAYALADNGYDVWLGNFRGNQYSRNHTSLNPDKDNKFWHFSWHEMGMFDLPAMIDYVLNVTNLEKLHYVGHSQGSTAFFVLASTLPEYNAKVKIQISLGPVIYMNHTPDSISRILAVLLNPIKKMLEILQINECLSSHQLLIKVSKALCYLFQRKCGNLLIAMFGYNPIKLTDVSIFMRFIPSGASIRQLLHYLQEVNSKCFRWYDHGAKNSKVYGAVRPPVYNLSLVTAPTYLFYSSGDANVGKVDGSRLCKKIRTACIGQFVLQDDKFSHVEYVLGNKAPKLVYQNILSVMEKY